MNERWSWYFVITIFIVDIVNHHQQDRHRLDVESTSKKILIFNDFLDVKKSIESTLKSFECCIFFIPRASLGLCDDPTPTNGNTVETDFSFGKWVTLTCDENFQLIGESQLQCVLGETQNDSKWSSQPPVCYGIDSIIIFLFNYLTVDLLAAVRQK